MTVDSAPSSRDAVSLDDTGHGSDAVQASDILYADIHSEDIQIAPDIRPSDSSPFDGSQQEVGLRDHGLQDIRSQDGPGDASVADGPGDAHVADALPADRNGNNDGAGNNDSASPPATFSLEIGFQRESDPPSASFAVVINVTDGNGDPVTGLMLSTQVSRGQAGAVTDRGDGSYRFSVAASAPESGEYAVTVSIPGSTASVTATALIFAEIGSRWGQPRRVDGLVNTAGWEDGAAVTADGEWLFITYVPQSSSCLIEGLHDACHQALGPWAAPERPGFPGANRIEVDGHVHNGCPSVGLLEEYLEPDPNHPHFTPNAIYGFRRQSDGSYAEPFVIAFEGADGCPAPYGPAVQLRGNNNAIMLLSFDEPGDDPDNQYDVYALEFVPGQPLLLGSYEMGDPDPVIQNNILVPIGAGGVPGQQGNPHFFALPGESITQIWFDDENEHHNEADRDLAVTLIDPEGTFPGGPWSPPTELPEPINLAGVGEIQPFFDGEEAILRQGNSIVCVPFTGSAPEEVTSASAWGTSETALAADSFSMFDEADALVTVGEPTKASRAGQDFIFFVYGIRRSVDNLDLNVGLVTEAQ